MSSKILKMLDLIEKEEYGSALIVFKCMIERQQEFVLALFGEYKNAKK